MKAEQCTFSGSLHKLLTAKNVVHEKADAHPSTIFRIDALIQQTVLWKLVFGEKFQTLFGTHMCRKCQYCPRQTSVFPVTKLVGTNVGRPYVLTPEFLYKLICLIAVWRLAKEFRKPDTDVFEVRKCWKFRLASSQFHFFSLEIVDFFFLMVKNILDNEYFQLNLMIFHH